MYATLVPVDQGVQRRLVGPARARQPLAQVLEHALIDVQVVGGGLGGRMAHGEAPFARGRFRKLSLNSLGCRAAVAAAPISMVCMLSPMGGQKAGSARTFAGGSSGMPRARMQTALS